MEPVETAGTLTPAQKALRDGWLGSKNQVTSNGEPWNCDAADEAASASLRARRCRRRESRQVLQVAGAEPLRSLRADFVLRPSGRFATSAPVAHSLAKVDPRNPRSIRARFVLRRARRSSRTCRDSHLRRTALAAVEPRPPIAAGRVTRARFSWSGAARGCEPQADEGRTSRVDLREGAMTAPRT